MKERTKTRVEELARESGSSLEKEEYEDLTSTRSSSEEEEGTKTPPRPDPVEEPELPPFEIHKPTTSSTPGRPTARPKRKASRKKLEGPSSSTRKNHRR